MRYNFGQSVSDQCADLDFVEFRQLITRRDGLVEQLAVLARYRASALTLHNPLQAFSVIVGTIRREIRVNVSQQIGRAHV